MVKVVRFFCIVGIIALLALFVGFTEFETNKPTKKNVAETELSEEPENNLNAEINEPKTSIHFSIFDLF